MAVSLNFFVHFNPVEELLSTNSISVSYTGFSVSSLRNTPLQVARSSFRSTVREITQIPSTPLPTNSTRVIKLKRRKSHLSATESDHILAEQGETSKNAESVLSSASDSPEGLSTTLGQETKKSSSPDEQSTPKRTLTAKERLRAARVFSRYSESKPARSEMGRSVLDALKESEKGKKGLPEAPTNLFDDSKRGLPKPGLTFNFPGGLDLFLIAFSFVFISTVMFATTYIVWKVGAIHFNEY